MSDAPRTTIDRLLVAELVERLPGPVWRSKRRGERLELRVELFLGHFSQFSEERQLDNGRSPLERGGHTKQHLSGIKARTYADRCRGPNLPRETARKPTQFGLLSRLFIQYQPSPLTRRLPN